MKKILIVEDEVPISEMIEHFLSSAGFDIMQAYDGLEAKEILDSQTKIDLILLKPKKPPYPHHHVERKSGTGRSFRRFRFRRG